MTIPFVELRRQHDALRDELDAALAEVLDGDRFVGGPHVEAFERAFAAFCGAREAVGVAYGTDAIELALRALGVGPGDEVIAPANTCVPTVAGIEARVPPRCSSTSTRRGSRSTRRVRATRPARARGRSSRSTSTASAPTWTPLVASRASTGSSCSRTPRRRTARAGRPSGRHAR